MKNLYTVLAIFILTSLQFFPQKINVPQNDIDLIKHWKELSLNERQKQIDELKNILTEQNFNQTQDLKEIKVKINLKLESLIIDLDNDDLLLQIIGLYRELKEKRKDGINKDFKAINNENKSLGRVTIRPQATSFWTGHVRLTTLGTYQDVDGEVTFGNIWTGYNYRGYVRFKINSIPFDATVCGIGMWYYVTEPSSSSSHTTLIKHLSIDPLIYGKQNLWDNIGQGSTLLNLANMFGGGTGWSTFYTTYANLILDLQQRINAQQSWWAIGFMESGDNDNYATFRGWNASGSPEPYFYVDYIIPPSATNGTNVTLNSFTANWGSVADAEGYRLDVSTNISFSSFVSGYSNLDVGNVTSKSVTGLTAGTTYYYRVRAYKNGFITANSNNISLATIPSPPTATAATNITQTSFTANWNSSTGATGYYLDVSTNNSFSSFVSGYNNLDVGNVTSKPVTGLNAGTPYYYRLRAYNTGGTSSNSNIINVITVPPNPVATAATNITQTSFTANWNSSTGATGYYLDISTNNSFSSFVSGYNNLDVGNVTSKPVTGLNAGTPYYYRLRAYNSGGTSGNSNTTPVTTVAPPPAPTATAATNITQTSFTANWNSSTGATGYYLDVSTNNSFSSFVSGYNNLDVGNVTSKPVTGLNAGTPYYYRLRAYNSGGTSGNSNTITVTLIPPDPVATKGTNVNPTSFTANWNVSTGATGYRLDVSTNSSFSSFVPGYNYLDVGNVTSKIVSGLVISTPYYHRVKAYNSAGESGYSNTPNPIVTSIEDLEFINGIPTDYSLLNNYPNPFNPSTFIEFGLPEESNTQLKIYDILGNVVAVLLDNETIPAGRFRYELSADKLPSGIYIYVLSSQSIVSKQSFRASKKMILLK